MSRYCSTLIIYIYNLPAFRACFFLSVYVTRTPNCLRRKHFFKRYFTKQKTRKTRTINEEPKTERFQTDLKRFHFHFLIECVCVCACFKVNIDLYVNRSKNKKNVLTVLTLKRTNEYTERTIYIYIILQCLRTLS